MISITVQERSNASRSGPNKGVFQIIEKQDVGRWFRPNFKEQLTTRSTRDDWSNRRAKAGCA
jgi:hypothetical protein